jgi:predicted RNA-binding Zn-ribbon protein involved in translation (DUF1610 family)
MTEKKTTQCPSCGKPLQVDFNVCPYCGMSVRIICAKCGQELKEEYNACPKCGQKVRGRSAPAAKENGSSGFSKRVAVVLTTVGSFFMFLGRVLKIIALTIFDWLKKISPKVIDWVKSLNWDKAGRFFQLIGAAIAKGAKKVFAWLQMVFGKVLDWLKSLDWGKTSDFFKSLGAALLMIAGKVFVFLRRAFSSTWNFKKQVFVRLRDFLSNLFEKKMSPEISKKMATGVIAVGGALSLFLIASLIFGGSGSPEKPSDGSAQGVQVAEVAAPQPAVDPSEQTWLVMVYADADDEVLEEDMLFDINEMELTGSSERVQVVVQVDRYTGGYAGDGDWTGARRYFIDQDADLSTLNSPLLAELGEVNMGDPLTLIDFVDWSVNSYPADRYVLILSDHGGGWTGGWTDPDPSYDYLSLNEMNDAFSMIVTILEGKKLDLIGFDACLMSQLDVYSTAAPYADFSVASEEVEPAAGWAYAAFLGRLVDNPAMNASDLASIIVETYLEQDQRYLDDAARANLFQGNTDFSAQDVIDWAMSTSTLTAIDLAYIPKVNQAMNDFAYYMTTLDQTTVAAARNYAPAFQTVFGKDTPPSFIDLVNFSLILENEAAAGYDPSAGVQLREALSEAIVNNKSGNEITGAQGVSFYFPNSVMYNHEYGGYQVYTSANTRFMEDTRWDDFLAYHYAGVTFDPESQMAVLPERAADVFGPGAGQIRVGDIVLSSDTVSPGEVLSFNTEIIGNNVGHVYMQYGWLAQDVRTMLVVLGMDFLRSDQTRQTGGEYYPDWGTSGTIPIEYEFEPMLGFIADQNEEHITFIEAVVSKYGATEEDITITVPGIFTFGRNGRQLYAEINFDNTGVMQDMIGYSGQIEIVDLETEFTGLFQIDYPGEEGAGSPYPLTPSVGDTFMPFFIGYIIEDDVYLNIKSDPIAFGKTPLKLVAASVTEFDDIDFPYYVAVVVEDLDGNLTDAVTMDTFTAEQ